MYNWKNKKGFMGSWGRSQFSVGGPCDENEIEWLHWLHSEDVAPTMEGFSAAFHLIFAF